MLPNKNVIDLLEKINELTEESATLLLLVSRGVKNAIEIIKHDESYLEKYSQEKIAELLAFKELLEKLINTILGMISSSRE